MTILGPSSPGAPAPDPAVETPIAEAAAGRAVAEAPKPRLRRASPWRVARRAAREFWADRCPQMAAAIAYFALFASIPVTALLVAVVGLLLRQPDVARAVLERALDQMPLESGLVIDGIRSVSQATEPLTVAGLIGLVWTSLGMFGSIQDALNVAWGVRSARHLLHQKLYDLGIMLGLGLLLLVSIAGTTALHTLRDAAMRALGGAAGRIDFLWDGLALGFPAAITFAALLLLYRYVPRVRHGFADVWPGALVATVLFELAKHGFAFYVASVPRAPVLYGALGAVLLFLAWVYLSAVVVLIGAEVASVYERSVRGRAPSRRAQPDVVFRPSPADAELTAP